MNREDFMKILVAITTAALVLGTATTTLATEADRRAAMKQIAGAAKAISGGQDVAANAQKIVDLSTQIPALFQENEVSSDSKARAEIWTNFADFTAKSQALQTAALAVVDAANNGGDVAGTARAMGGACGSCHQSYKFK